MTSELYCRFVDRSTTRTFAYISGSPFVLQQAYGLSAQQFSLIFAANGLGMVLLGQLSGFLVGRVGTENTLLRVNLTTAPIHQESRSATVWPGLALRWKAGLTPSP